MRLCTRILLTETAALLLHTALSNSATADTRVPPSVSSCALSSLIQAEKSHQTAAPLSWLMSLLLTQVEGTQSLLEKPHVHRPSDGF